MHGKPVSEDQEQAALDELGSTDDLLVEVRKPDPGPGENFTAGLTGRAGATDLGGRGRGGDPRGLRRGPQGARRRQGGRGRPRRRGQQLHEVRGVRRGVPGRYFEMFIAEQQMVSAAVGMSVRHRVPFASSFAAFFTRAYDFIRMAAISGANIRLSGSHAGVSIGEDGPSQMALEDIAMMRAVHGSTVLQPCDANQTAKLVAEMADTDGIVFLRTLRPKTPVIYDPSEDFPIGGSKIVRSSDDDAVTVVAVGHHGPRSHQGRRRTARERPGRARHRRLLHQADRRRDTARRCTGNRGQRRRRSRTTGRKAASARPSSPPSPEKATPSTSSTSPWKSCQARVSPKSLWTQQA